MPTDEVTPPPDPPLGFRARDLGALRLSEHQTRSLKVISAAPLTRFYPEQARLANISGTATLDVLVDSAGNVVDVRLLDESPVGQGFGDAAVSAACTFKYHTIFGRLTAHVGRIRFSADQP